MHTYGFDRTVVTAAPPEFVDITSQVEDALEASPVADGQVTITAPPGCAIIVNEFESGLLSDIKRTLERLGATSNGSEPRIGAVSVVLPASEGRLRLGRWQRLLLVELEKSTERSVSIQVVGD